MADDKRGRDAQARNEDDRQRERDLAAALERGDETEPPVEAEELGDFETELAAVSFPATGTEIVQSVGEQTVRSSEGTHAVAELVPETDSVVFEEPADVTARIQRPTVAGAMKRVVEASETLRNAEVGRSQREAYEKTFRALKAIDADDEDEGVRAIADWIIDRIEEKEKLPGSRDVRRQAAKFCRSNGYEIRTDEWLGV